MPRKIHFFLWRFRKFHIDLSIFRPWGCGLPRGGRVVHQETVSLSPDLDDPAGPSLFPWVLSRNHKPNFPQRLSPEREGGVDYSRAAALSVAATAPPQLLTGPQHPVRPELVPECLAFDSPRKRRPAAAAFRCRRSSAIAASSAEFRGPSTVWRWSRPPRRLRAEGSRCRWRRPKSGWRRRCKWWGAWEVDAAGGNFQRFSSQPYQLSKRPGCFLITTISMAGTLSGWLALLPWDLIEPILTEALGEEERKYRKSFSLRWSMRQISPFSCCWHVPAAPPSFPWTHSQMREVTLCCIYDPLNQSGRGKPSMCLVESRIKPSSSAARNYLPFIHPSTHPTALCPFISFHPSLWNQD